MITNVGVAKTQEKPDYTFNISVEPSGVAGRYWVKIPCFGFTDLDIEADSLEEAKRMLSAFIYDMLNKKQILM